MNQLTVMHRIFNTRMTRSGFPVVGDFPLLPVFPSPQPTPILTMPVDVFSGGPVTTTPGTVITLPAPVLTPIPIPSPIGLPGSTTTTPTAQPKATTTAAAAPAAPWSTTKKVAVAGGGLAGVALLWAAAKAFL
jgi:hypothetical protein